MRRLIPGAVGLGLALGLTALGGRAHAQAQPDTLVWERVGTINDVRGIFFDGDTLYAAAIGDPTQALRPGDADWSQAFPTAARAKDLLITPDRTIFGLSTAASGLWRSIDWGQTGEGVQDDAFTLPVATSEGALLLGTRGSSSEGGRLAARSTDGGATWTPRGLGDDTDGLGTTHLVVTPPAETLPTGRIVAAGFGGLAYSDDDGRSWLPTALYGGLAYAAWAAARIETGPHDGGHPGRLLAVVERGTPQGEPTGLYTSDDSGATWTRLGPIPGGGTFDTRLTAAPDGAVYAYRRQTDEAPVWRTTDGGQTWANLGPVWVAWPAEVREIAVGPEGRLWAACSGGGFAGFDGGVFRTTEAVVAVSAEGSPEEPGKLAAELEAYPNPTDGAASIVLTLAATAEVRVEAFDTLGRAVAVLHEGRLAAGSHEWVLDGAALPTGVYVVRAEGEGFRATRWVTLLR
jgi:hypothetical protein